MNSPWVAPGTYSVRLTVDGKSSTQPITVKMDPRVKETLGVQQIYTLTTQMERRRDGGGGRAEGRARRGRETSREAAVRGQRRADQGDRCDRAAGSRKRGGAGGGGFGGRGAGGGGRGGRGGGRGAAPRCGRASRRCAAGAAPETAAQTLASIGPALVAAVMPMQAAEMPPTAAQLKACTERQAEFAAVMAKWNALKLKLKAAGV